MFNDSTNLGMSSTSATFYNNVFINGATTLNNALYIYGSTTLNNNLLVSGTTTLTGAAILNNNLTVAGQTTINNMLFVNNNVELTGVLNYSGSSIFYINKGTNTDTLLYGNHVCFGNTSAAIQTAANGNPFLYGFYSGINIIPVTIVSNYNTAYPSL